MKHIQSTLLTLTLCAVAASPLAAQRGDGQGPGGNRPPMPPLVAALDLDRDGSLSTEEIANAPESLAALDRNNDGQLTRSEIHPRQPRPDGRMQGNRDGSGSGDRAERRAGPGGGGGRVDGDRPNQGNRPNQGERPRGPAPLIKALDADGDRVLSAAEIENSWKSLLDLDTDADGVISREEMRPERPRNGGKGARAERPQGRTRE